MEPFLSQQWFVKMDQLAQNGLDKVLKKEVEFIPDHWIKTFEHWMKNIQDWCISRQLWWGASHSLLDLFRLQSIYSA